MKNCEEMVNSLLERRDRYAAERKRKKAIMVRAVSSACCVCMVALLGFGAWQNGMLSRAPSAQPTDGAKYPDMTESKGEGENTAIENDKIIIHSLDGLTADKSNICLLADDFVAMDEEELNDYYGICVFPTVPEDILKWQDQQFGIYKRDGGTGDVYWDGTGINYANADFSRTVNIEVAKGSLPLCDYVFLKTTEEKSVIHNVELAIGHSENGYYYAQFLYCNVGFQINARGVTQAEFVSILSSLIK